MKALKKMEVVEEFAAGFLFLSAVLISLFEVFMRYVLQSPQFGINEIVGILMPWAIFVGFGRALKQDHHISVDVVYDRFPFPIKRVLAVISNLIGAGYGLFLLITGVKMVLTAISDGFNTVALGIPIWITYIILPVSMTMFCAYFIHKTYKAILGDKQEIMGSLDHATYISESEKEEKIV
ncbi:TRAP transporter small permease [Virgibacillus sp. DJP39]|uniref:TRAP transporter small permease n=1 Tax=Virgibacillus sp. DJP39 TaxID=3409790 RepID=UPI003BB731F7